MEYMVASHENNQTENDKNDMDIIVPGRYESYPPELIDIDQYGSFLPEYQMQIPIKTQMQPIQSIIYKYDSDSPMEMDNQTKEIDNKSKRKFTDTVPTYNYYVNNKRHRYNRHHPIKKPDNDKDDNKDDKKNDKKDGDASDDKKNNKSQNRKSGRRNSTGGSTDGGTNNTNNSNTTNPMNPFIPLLLLLGNMDDDEHEEPVVPVVPPYVCPGKNCDHDPESKNIPVIPDRLLNRKDGYQLTLADLIDLGLAFHCKLQTTFNDISLERLAKLSGPLAKLHRTIGMSSIKTNFVEQIIYFLQDLQPNGAEMLHTILEGPPGVGKSYIVDVLAEIYLNMGYLKKNIIKKARRSDLIGKYLGHTASMTQKIIDESLGGILVLDEGYSLGNPQKRDSFSKECIDTINRNLTEHAGEFVCFILGYEEELDKSFFSHNPGLKSRFRFKFTIDNYSSDELCDIFNLKVNNDGWKIDENLNPTEQQDFFKENHSAFKYFGRSIESLLFHTKVAHANRVFFESKDNRTKITMADIEMGFKKFAVHNSVKKDTSDMPLSVRHIYS